MSKDSALAFPIVRAGDRSELWQGGLTKRELFAAMAMQGLLSDADTLIAMGKDVLKRGGKQCADHLGARVALAAVAHADALLAELDKERS